MTTLTFRKVRASRPADDHAIKVALFRDDLNRVCAWYLGPVRLTPTGVDVPYLPRSERVLASVAIVRAIAAAERNGAPLCIVDPMDLWEPAWKV